MDSEVRAALRSSGGILARREHPALAKRLDRLRANNELECPLPGICALPGALDTPEGLIAAGALWCGPGTVVCGLAAARLTFWPDCRVAVVDLSVRHCAKASRSHWRVRRRDIPVELLWPRGPWWVTSPALTAVDLACGPNGGDVIDRVLRTRAATLSQIRRALELTPARNENPVRAALIEDSRDEPWSEAERELHRLLRAAGLNGWSTNVWIGEDSDGYVADVVFEAAKLIIEVDGWEFHGSRDAFEADRRRRNALVLRGYTVLNFTWRQIVDDPDYVLSAIVRAVDSAWRQPSARKM